VDEAPPVAITLPAIADAALVVQAVRDGIKLLIGLRWIDHPGQPVACARSFATAWSGGFFTEMEVYAAIRALANARVIVRVGIDPKSCSDLWLPGTVAKCVGFSHGYQRQCVGSGHSSAIAHLQSEMPASAVPGCDHCVPVRHPRL
jgi:hypothetical protein